MSLRFDHIAFAALSLDAAQACAETCFGQLLPQGGKHPAMATHNLLTALGPAQFLEVIAVDPEAAPPGRPRWFGLDDPDIRDRLHLETVIPHALVLACDDLDAAITHSASLGHDLGEAVTLTRGDLRWRMAVRPDGRMAPFGFGPMLMQWPAGPHPAARMTDFGLRLERITVTTPQPEAVNAWLAGMGGLIDGPPLVVKEGPSERLQFALMLNGERLDPPAAGAH